MKNEQAPEAPVILTDVDERIGVITLNRPHRLNALNGALIDALGVCRFWDFEVAEKATVNYISCQRTGPAYFSISAT